MMIMIVRYKLKEGHVVVKNNKVSIITIIVIVIVIFIICINIYDGISFRVALSAYPML